MTPPRASRPTAVAATPADRLVTSRVRVPNPVKARLAARVLSRRGTLPARTVTTPQTGGSS